MKKTVFKPDMDTGTETSHVYFGSDPTLSAYFRQISKSVLLTVYEEKSLMKVYFKNMDIVRDNVYKIGFVADELVKLIDRLAIWDIDEYFYTSVRNKSNESVSHIFSSLKEWKSDITKAAVKLRHAFNEKNENAVVVSRAELGTIFHRHRVLSDVVEEWLDDAREYISFLDEKNCIAGKNLKAFIVRFYEMFL